MLMASGLTIPFPIVAATAVPDMAPRMFRQVASRSARAGERTRVETTVAIALGASVQPFTNSAARTRPRTKRIAGDASMDQAFLRTIPSITLATSSHLSVADYRSV